MRILLLGAAVALTSVGAVSAQTVTLNANSTANNGGSSGWAMFFDVSSSGSPLTVTELTTASTAVAGGTYTVEVFTRPGSALGGPVAAGPGSSPAGWTSLGTAPATQGATANGISLPINIPDIPVTSSVTGVAVLFTGAGPRYFGTGSPPLQTFSDANLTLVTGEGRSAPFTPTGSWFSSRGMTGSLSYTIVPEPGCLTFLAASALLLRRRRAH